MKTSTKIIPLSDLESAVTFSFVVFLWATLLTSAARAQEDALPPPTLEEQLQKEDPAVLAKAARQQGEAARGAILFYQQHTTCTKCHTFGEKDSPLGPNLTKPEKKPTDVFLVESILKPSKEIRKGFEPIIVITDEGKQLTGLLVEETAEKLVLRDPKKDGEPVTFNKDEIDEQAESKQSIMPPGLMNQLANRQQFLDLLRYVMAITEGGPQRALDLAPEPSLYAPPPLPEYEKRVDHAGMIADLNQESFKRGEAIYNRLCINCHGTKDKPGSLPTSLRFASDKFRNGSDPHSMYKTLTHGFGMMVAQTWMVPQQKYDAIHYVRETYLKQHNKSQYVEADKTYLAGLPKGDTRGPAPSKFEPWVAMDYGPNLTASYEIGRNASNFAYKGIAIRLDAGAGGVTRGQYWMIFDEDTLRAAAAWSGEQFIDYNAIMLNGRHAIHPRIVGQLHFENKAGPGWGNPETGAFDDPRFLGRDKRPYGPMPRDWARYKGLYHHGNRVIVSYTVGDATVLELPAVDPSSSPPIFTRTLNIGLRRRDMIVQVAHQSATDAALHAIGDRGSDGRIAVFGPGKTPDAAGMVVAGISQPIDGAKWLAGEKGNLRLKIPAGNMPLKFTLSVARAEKDDQFAPVVEKLAANRSAMDLAPMTKGGPPRWPGTLATVGKLGSDDIPYTSDVLTHPDPNPWFCRVRCTGFDFMPDGNRAAVCCWDGDVWMVAGITEPEKGMTWQRIASGMFQPLGVKVVGGKIYITCRDQIAILHDLNGDGETDFYENFNNDHQVTEHFHEFAMGLQTDDEGNFYYAKSARHAKTALVPHHGTLLKVSQDGSKTEIIAKGFRAANGICLNPDGSFMVTDQEGHWTPKNRINRVIPHSGSFYGNMFGYHDVTDSSDDAMEQPLCWITNAFDRSPAELIWVTSDKWGPLKGQLLNTSYGYGMVYVVPFEKVEGQVQGGMCRFPIQAFPTGVMRPRFHPQNGQLYLAGMFAWAGSRHQPGGFYRLRYTGRPAHLPVGLNATTEGMTIAFSGELDGEAAGNPDNYSVKIWGLKRAASYGSKHYNTRALKVTAATLWPDLKTVSLKIPDIETTWCMEIRYRLKGAGGERVDSMIHNSVYRLGKPKMGRKGSGRD